jgi:nicotinate phosphoribosyltransferase
MQPRMKLSQDVEKVNIPGRKNAYRLYNDQGVPLVDLLQLASDPEPVAGERVLVRHPFAESKRAHVTPGAVRSLYTCFWRNGIVCAPLPSIHELRARVQRELAALRPDHKRALNPTPFKVSVTESLYKLVHKLWLQSAPISELS